MTGIGAPLAGRSGRAAASTIGLVPALTPWDFAGIFGAGLVAGTVNTVVGSGSLLTFPTLIAFGLDPRVANVTNTVGLVPGSVSGAFGYRRELTGQRSRVQALSASSLAGGLLGAGLLLLLPSSSFEKVVPFLVLVACALVVVQPRLAARVAARNAARGHHPSRRDPLLQAGVFVTAIYGGYFGAAQGVILIALLAIFIDDHLQRLNAVKNVLAALVNGIAALLFIAFAPVAWWVALSEAAGAIIGGQIGARVGRRLPATLLRAIIVVAGVGVSVKLFLSW